MPSLINIVRDKFLDAIRSVNPPGRWKILVVDEHSQKLLGSVLKQFDVLQENVTQIENIANNRDVQPGFEAIYLLMPTSQNVDRIIRDFSDGRQHYAGAHLFFVEGLAESLFQRLTASPAEPFLKGLKELFINFWATEAQTFSIQDPAQFFSIYSPPRSESLHQLARERLEEDLRFNARLIANVCITLNEFPYIRYYMPQSHLPLGPLKPNPQTRPPPPPESASRWRSNLARGADARAYEAVETDFVTKLLAFMVQATLEEHKKNNPEFAKTPESVRPRSTLIITDRSMDSVAPFIHEFTYQAMANDLLPIMNGTKYTYKFQSSLGAYEDKTATLSDSDTVWTEVRHMHMREAIDKLMADFNKFLEENAVFKGEGAANLNDMKEMLASYHNTKSKEKSMAQECMAIFERAKLPDVATVEQCCATGVNAEGKTPKSLVEEMVPLLDSREVHNIDKVRVIALYVQYRDGVPDEDRRRLYQHARLTLAEQDAVNALVHLGVRITRNPTDKDLKKKLKQNLLLKNTNYLEDQVADKLDNTMFPYVREAPTQAPLAQSLRSPPPQTTSLRSQKPAWHRAPKPGAIANDHKQRIFVFVAGGMTYSEQREAYNLSTSLNKDIFIGSTHTFTPREFVDDLKVLDLGGTGSRAVPNGLRDMNGGQRSYQEFYDERYYTKDAPPPQKVQTGGGLSAPKSSAPKLSPTNSTSGSIHSLTPSAKEEKKKKKGFFRF
ncbi:Sec1-like snare protein [Cyathus striatus]|nr:Sec1-like snare protein [Cyathus striatus]